MALEDSLVAILGPSGTPVGAGVLVERDLVLTCAHVVNVARGRSAAAQGRPAGTVKLRHHLLPNQIISASVDEPEDAWRDPPPWRQLGADLCLLRVSNGWGDDLQPARLRDFDNLSQREFRAAGFPKDWALDFAEGRIVGRDTNGLYVLRPDSAAFAVISTQAKGGAWSSEKPRPPGVIYSGFSGAPVEVDGKIAGLVSEARAPASDATAYMIPVAAFPVRIFRQAESDYRTYLEAIEVEPNPLTIHISRTVVRQSRDPGTVPVEPVETKLEAKPESIESALESFDKIVLLADPGLGKSTALTYLESVVASNTLHGCKTAWHGIPIRLELKSYAGESDLEMLLAARVDQVLTRKLARLSGDPGESTRILKDWLTSGKHKFLLLLDGLDEVPPQFHLKIRTALKGLLNYPHRFVVSCRIADYDGSLQNHVALFVLQELQPEEIESYLQQRLGDRGKALFKGQLQPQPRILTLASNPMLLDTMASIAEQDPRCRIPANPGQLLQQFVKLMPLRRQSDGFPPKVPPDVVATALGRLGLEMVDRRQVTAAMGDVRQWPIPRDEYKLEDILDAANEWRLLQSDGRRGEPVQFIHPLFREYFAAELLHSELKQHAFDYATVLRGRAWERPWDQAIVMLAGISSRSPDMLIWLAQDLQAFASTGFLFTGIKRSSLFWLWLWSVNQNLACGSLLMRCWETSPARGREDVRTGITDALCAVLRYSEASVRSRAGWVECKAAIAGLREIGDKRALEDLDHFAERQQEPHGTPSPIQATPDTWRAMFLQSTKPAIRHVSELSRDACEAAEEIRKNSSVQG